MPIFLRDFPYGDHLTARENAMKSPGQYQPWNTSKIPWMRFTSNVLVDGGRLKYSVLSGGSAKTLEDLYDTSSRNTPTPGVLDATVKHKGSMGSLKEIVVNYKCWNLAQLNQLEKLFMSLGKTVALEYGWSIKPNGSRVSSALGYDGCSKEFVDFFSSAQSKIKTEHGCYGAEKGVVSNFSWTQDDDGSYSCSTTFVTPSEMMMSKDTNKSTDQICCKTSKDAEDKEACKKQSDLERPLDEIVTGQVMPVGKLLVTAGGVPLGTTIKMDKETTEEERENAADKSWWSATKKFFGATSFNVEQPYISWSYFEEEIVNKTLMDKSPTDSKSHILPSDIQTCQAGFRRSNIKCSTRLDCRGTKILNLKDSFTSADPTVCLLPGQFVWDMFNYGEGLEDFTNTAGLYRYAEKAPFDTGEDNKGWLGNILLNVYFLKRCAKESNTLEELLSKVLSGINSACGNYWDLIVMPLEANASIMTIIDSKSLGKKVITSHTINVFGNSSICRSVNIDTKVPNAIKAQIMYGSNKKGDAAPEGGEFSLFGKGLSDATKSWNNLTQEVPDPCKGPDEASTDNKKDSPEEVLHEAIDDLMEGVEDETINAVKAAIKGKLNEGQVIEKNQDPPLLPINLGFSLDGYNGFLWGHSVKAKPVPSRYKDIIFMVKGIEHKINASTWETTIQTVLRIVDKS
tara:strand:- start:44667 stop:46715 length:2049 start_codon:yes stop_codon:yes gene_type:complete